MSESREFDKKQVINLQYYFTTEERLDLAERQARATEEKRALEERKAAIAKQIGSEITEKDAELQKLNRLVSNRYEYRDIECGIYWDTPRKGVATVIRIDTGEVVRERPMDMNELQHVLDFEARQQEVAAQEAEQPADSIADAVAEAVVEQVNTGALDSPGCKVTACVIRGNRRKSNTVSADAAFGALVASQKRRLREMGVGLTDEVIAALPLPEVFTHEWRSAELIAAGVPSHLAAEAPDA